MKPILFLLALLIVLALISYETDWWSALPWPMDAYREPSLIERQQR